MSRPILPLPNSSFYQSPFHPPQRDDLRPPPPPLPPPPPPPPPPPGPSKPSYAKRGKITIVACVPCRKRKTKCDGKRPTCSQCIARENACLYDMTDEQRRLTHLRSDVEQLTEERNALESLLVVMQSGSDEYATGVLRQLRSGVDVHELAQMMHASRMLAEVRGDVLGAESAGTERTSPVPRSLTPARRNAQYEEFIRAIKKASPLELNEIMRRLRLNEDVPTIMAALRSGTLLRPISAREVESGTTPGIEADYSSRDKTFGLVKGAGPHVRRSPPEPADPVMSRIGRWTTVTDDSSFVHHLLSLYFTWQHSFFQGFPDKLFRDDLDNGRNEYCSSLLVNAVCAAGCLLSDRPEARRDPNDPRTAGLDFFDESVRLLNESRDSSIPTTAALYLLCHIEGNRGHLSSLWQYSGRSARMALDINLHLRSDKPPSDELAKKEDGARVHTFWGCFIADQITSFTLGRIPQIPINAVTVDLPPIHHDVDQEPWSAPEVMLTKSPGASSTVFNQVAALSKIVNSTLIMFFAPSQIMSGSLLLDEYNKYLTFYARLPPIVASIDDAPPHTLSLHMYYHAAVLLLFRPFLKAQFTESDVSPREVCRQSANAISDIFAQHKRLYSLAGLSTFQVHCLLTACTIHIINVPTISSTNYFTAACNSFHELVQSSEWATGSLNIIKGLVQKWNIILPLEAEIALYRNPEALSSFDFGAGQSSRSHGREGETSRPEKRTYNLTPSAQAMQKRQRLAPVLQDRPAAGPSSTGAVPPLREPSTNYLFAPFPNAPAPLLGPIHTSTSADTEWNDELSKVAQGFDGLNFSGDDWFDPFMGYQGELSSGFMRPE